MRSMPSIANPAHSSSTQNGPRPRRYYQTLEQVADCDEAGPTCKLHGHACPLAGDIHYFACGFPCAPFSSQRSNRANARWSMKIETKARRHLKRTKPWLLCLNMVGPPSLICFFPCGCVSACQILFSKKGWVSFSSCHVLLCCSSHKVIKVAQSPGCAGLENHHATHLSHATHLQAETTLWTH